MPALFFSFWYEIIKKYFAQSSRCCFVYYYNIIMEVIQIAILFSQVKVQSADQSETVQISGIHKEYDDIMGKPWRPHYRISISLVILTKRTAGGQVKCSRHRVARRRLVRRNHRNLGRFLDLLTRWGDDSIDFNFLLCLSKSIPRGF